jgi:hypothetical protein
VQAQGVCIGSGSVQRLRQPALCTDGIARPVGIKRLFDRRARQGGNYSLINTVTKHHVTTKFVFYHAGLVERAGGQRGPFRPKSGSGLPPYCPGSERFNRFPCRPGGQNRTQSAALLPSVRVGAPAALLSRGARSQAGGLHAASASSIVAGQVAGPGPGRIKRPCRSTARATVACGSQAREAEAQAGHRLESR